MEIKSAKFEISSPEVSKCPASGIPEYAFIGRSNVGKSSLINMLCKNKKLAKTSQLPGKTLLINHFNINGGEWYLVDLPGYGFASRGKDQREKLTKIINDYVLDREQLTLLFVLIDIRHSPQKIDIEFIDWLGEHGVPFAIIFTKADKLGPVAGRKKVDEYLAELKLTWEELPPYFITSSEKGTGRSELLDYIGGINDEIKESCRNQEDNKEVSEDGKI